MVESSGNNPFQQLPYPSAGERIRADDFTKLSRSLKIVSDAFSLSASLFGSKFGQAKLALTSQQYEIRKAVSVFGAELDGADDGSLDNRRVLQVAPATLGERQVVVILSEVVETRRLTPNLLGLTHREASERLRSILGDVAFPETPMNAPDLVGSSLADAKKKLSE
jgi:hypothetical protein